MKTKKAKPIRKKPVTKASMNAEIASLNDRMSWATRIITLQQSEIDRLMKQNESLTEAINNMAKDRC